MPQNHLVNISINGAHMDSFTVRVLDSACSHGRAMLSITGLIDTNRDDIYTTLQNDQATPFTVVASSGQRMMFNRIVGQTYQLTLFHVDLTAGERSAQMQARFNRV